MNKRKILTNFLKLYQYLKNPSPPIFLWLGEQRFLKLNIKFTKNNLFKEIIKQFYWWIKISIFYQLPKFWNYEKYNLPQMLKIKANLLNSYTYEETICWFQLGLISWEEISKKKPSSINNFRHLERHKMTSIPRKEDKNILDNKLSLLKLIPKENSYPFFLCEGNINLTKRINTPDWVFESLNNNGLVLKPLSGSNSMGVIQFKIFKDFLYYRFIRSPFEEFKKLVLPCENLNLGVIYSFWEKIVKTKSKAIAMPYLTCENDIFNRNHNLNLRIVTKKNFLNSKVSIHNSFIQIYISKKFATYFDVEGNSLPLFLEELTEIDLLNLEKWKSFLKYKRSSEINQCIERSILFHSFVPSIDQIAWDWIPCKNNPKLLEGNCFYSLFLPDMFDYYLSKY